MFRRKRALRSLLRRSFVVTKVDGSMFQGALLEEDSEWLTFGYVKIPNPRDDTKWVEAAQVPLLIHVSRIDYMQKLNIVDVGAS